MFGLSRNCHSSGELFDVSVLTKYNQTCIKRPPFETMKNWPYNRCPLKRGSIHMKISITGQVKVTF